MLTSYASISLPQWLINDLPLLPDRLSSVEEQMALAVKLSRRNSEENTGGPFGTVIVESDSGKLVAVGVNRVVPTNNPLLHGEAVAIAMAGAALRNFNLGGEGMPAHRLVTSAQPCVMCVGATLWCGVRELVTGASGDDVQSITGFDEGPIHPDWANELGKRGVKVTQGVLRQEARAALQFYVENGGFIYNGR